MNSGDADEDLDTETAPRRPINGNSPTGTATALTVLLGALSVRAVGRVLFGMPTRC